MSAARITAGATARPELGPELAELLNQWLPSRRWFAGKASASSVAQLELLASWPLDALGVERLEWLLVELDEGQRYSVPLLWSSMSTTAAGNRASSSLGGNGNWSDALEDPRARLLLLQALGAATRLHNADGTALVMTPDAELAATVTAAGNRLAVGSLGVEQSNTSLVVGEPPMAILKMYRRLAPGRNPEVEIASALARVHCTGVPAWRGTIALLTTDGSAHGSDDRSAHGSDDRSTDGSDDRDVAMHLGFAQEFVRASGDGWAMATRSAVIGDQAAASSDESLTWTRELGDTIAMVHRDLARALPDGVWGAPEVAVRLDKLRRHLDEVAAEVPELAPLREPLLAALSRLTRVHDSVAVQRIHGDLHLGQVIRSDCGWAVIDFEGEPARPLADRTALDSPWRDVAGMLRSYDYAAAFVGRTSSANPRSSHARHSWARRHRAAFLSGYLGGRDATSDEQVLLTAFEIDKAVYECRYEAQMRPDWLPIPLKHLQALVAAGDIAGSALVTGPRTGEDGTDERH